MLIRIVIAAILLGSAVLKLVGMNQGTAEIGWLASPSVRLGVIVWESVLALWLLSWWAPAGAWFGAVTTFSVFAFVSVQMIWVGQASCGCLGVVRTPPHYILILDVLVLASLIGSRPSLRDLGKELPSYRPILGYGISASVVLLALGLFGGLWFGSVRGAVAFLRGEPWSVTPGYQDLGPQPAGETVEAAVEVVNWGPKPLHVLAGTTDCSCATVTDLPLRIAPRESAEVRVRIHLPEKGRGAFARTVILLSDCPSKPQVAFRVGCLVE